MIETEDQGTVILNLCTDSGVHLKTITASLVPYTGGVFAVYEKEVDEDEEQRIALIHVNTKLELSWFHYSMIADTVAQQIYEHCYRIFESNDVEYIRGNTPLQVRAWLKLMVEFDRASAENFVCLAIVRTLAEFLNAPPKA